VPDTVKLLDNVVKPANDTLHGFICVIVFDNPIPPNPFIDILFVFVVISSFPNICNSTNCNCVAVPPINFVITHPIYKYGISNVDGNVC